MGDKVVHAVGERSAVDQGTVERLAHDAVNISIAAVRNQQVEILAEHGLHMLSAFTCQGNHLPAAIHALYAFKDICILFEELDRKPAPGIRSCIEIHFLERFDDPCDLAFDLAAVIQLKEGWEGDGHGLSNFCWRS